jgi:hypothetical protein
VSAATRAPARGGEQQPDHLRPAAEQPGPEGREQRPRHPEHHRAEVGHEDPLERLLPAQEAQPGPDRGEQAGVPVAALARRERPQRRRERGRHGEGDQLDHVGRGQVGPGHDHSGQGRAGDHPDLHEDLVQGGRGREQLAPDQGGDAGVAGRGVDRVQPGLEGGEHEQRPHRRAGEQGVGDQPGAQCPARQLHPQQQLAPVDPVGDGPADQGEQQERDELGQAEQSDQERRAGDQVDLEGDRDHGDLAAEDREQLAEVEAAVLSRFPERRGVAEETPPGPHFLTIPPGRTPRRSFSATRFAVLRPRCAGLPR